MLTRVCLEEIMDRRAGALPRPPSAAHRLGMASHLLASLFGWRVHAGDQSRVLAILA